MIVKEYQKSMETPKLQQGDWYSRLAGPAGLKKISWELFEKEGINEI